jgi:hypothetical protein
VSTPRNSYTLILRFREEEIPLSMCCLHSSSNQPWVVPLPVAAVGVRTTPIVGLAPNAARRWSQEDVDRGRRRAGHQQEGGEGGQVNHDDNTWWSLVMILGGAGW